MPFRILALDGGGIRGAISARILQKIEEKLKDYYQKDIKLNEYFHLISGTSTGSILAAGLANGMSSQELQKIYRDEGEKIFPYQHYYSLKRLPFVVEYKLSNLQAAFKGIFKDISDPKNPGFNPTRLKQLLSVFKASPKFSHKGLIEVLIEHLKDIKITNLEGNLLILSYDTFYRNTTFFTNYKQEHRWYDDMELWQICVSSSSAPTFFPPYEFQWKEKATDKGEEWKFPYVDGGVSANNPALAAVVHAMLVGKLEERKKVENIKLEDISVLSVGTGRTTDPYDYEQVRSWGLLDWAQTIPNIFMGGQAQISADVCRQLIKSINPNAYLRLQFELNQRFDPKTSSGLPRRVLPKDKQFNEFTNTKVSEAIDDGRKENVETLIKTAEAFVNSKNNYTTDAQGNPISLEQAIENFIKNNSSN